MLNGDLKRWPLKPVASKIQKLPQRRNASRNSNTLSAFQDFKQHFQTDVKRNLLYQINVHH